MSKTSVSAFQLVSLRVPKPLLTCLKGGGAAVLTSEGPSLSVLTSFYLRNAGESNRHGRITVANRF
jgi:hypothetical protein